MKRNLLIILLCVIALHLGYTQTLNSHSSKGNVCKELSYKSDILGYEVRYAIYFPPGYADSEKHYPVMYLLHGYNDNHKSWLTRGKIQHIMDEGIAKGEIEPMILIIPDGKYYWYINDYQNKVRYEDFIFQEFLPFIDKTYKTIPNKEHRAVAGLSMGGYGALVWSMHHPEKFSYCIALSASIFTEDGLMQMPDQLYKFMSMLYGAPEAKGNDRITEHFLKNSPLKIAETMTSNSLKTIKWVIDCGNEDRLKDVNKTLHELLTNRNIEHIYHARKGKHNWQFWREGIYQGIKYVSGDLRNK